MLGQIIGARIAAVVIVGAALAATGAAASTQHDPGDNDGKSKGQGDRISALARSTPGGPGKGAIISAAAKGHGKAVSAEASKNGKAHAAKAKANGKGAVK
jgi:hypothetical protein